MQGVVGATIPGARMFSVWRPREKFAQTFAASFLMPASKVRALIEREFGGRRPSFEHMLYLKRYLEVSCAAMLRRVRELRYVSGAQFEDYVRRNPDTRELEVFGGATGEAKPGGAEKASAPTRFILIAINCQRIKYAPLPPAGFARVNL